MLTSRGRVLACGDDSRGQCGQTRRHIVSDGSDGDDRSDHIHGSLDDIIGPGGAASRVIARPVALVHTAGADSTAVRMVCAGHWHTVLVPKGPANARKRNFDKLRTA